MDALDQAMSGQGATGFVVYGSSENANTRYLTRFTTTDPVVFFKKHGEAATIIVSQMEMERALRESSTKVMTRADAGLFEILAKEPDRWRATARMISGLAGTTLLVPADFPFLLAHELQEYARVIPDRNTVEGMRAVKTAGEITLITSVQAVTDKAMDHAVNLIRRSKIKTGVLYRGAVPLTSEFIRTSMERVFLAYDCHAQDTIVSCGQDTAYPHIRGEGPLSANEPIVIDVFPRSNESGYFSDMSRTVLKGEAAPEIIDMYQAVKEAQAYAAGRIRPGVSGDEVHQAVVRFFKERGYPSGKEGFIHNLGHGVGLEVHELPSLGPGGGTLSAGNVVTNEPGLYLPGIGGVRLENTGVVTKNGFGCLTHYEEELII
jgi:Xaa-Pro aminopeptidase